MNVELLRKIKKHILEEPRRLYMGDWISHGKAGEPIDRDIKRSPKFAKCGTAACIGGWAKILSGYEQYYQGPSFEKVLGLDIMQGFRLFYRGQWPNKFKKAYKDDGSKKSAKVAADRIEHFIATEGRE